MFVNISEYELKRKLNMEANQNLLAQMGLVENEEGIAAVGEHETLKDVFPFPLILEI